MQSEDQDHDAAEAAELLVRGFQQQATRGNLQQSDAAPVLQPHQVVAALGPERRLPGGALPPGLEERLLSQAPRNMPAPPPAAPSLSTHSQSRSLQSRRSKQSGGGGGGGNGGGSGGGRGPTPTGTTGGLPFVIPRGKAAKAAQGDATLHPILRLGWQPLCSVVCNGLTGEFLGGHGMDLYIRCTAPQYAELPLIDVNLGGCIMTCSQFERAAGRELSKKWKESIHVVGEGVGSVATLISWMKRRAAQDYGTQVVGKTVWVCWCGDLDFYQGRITAYSKDTGKHQIQYGDNHSEELHLPVELLSFDPVKPRPAPAAPAAATAGGGLARAGGQQERGETGRLGFSFPHSLPESVEEELWNPLWHQGSGISVTSSFQDDHAAASRQQHQQAQHAQHGHRAPAAGGGGGLGSPSATPTSAGAAAAARSLLGPSELQQLQQALETTHPKVAVLPAAAAPAAASGRDGQGAAAEAGAGMDAGGDTPRGMDQGAERARSGARKPLAGSKRGLQPGGEGSEGAGIRREISLTIPPATAEAVPAGEGPAAILKRMRSSVGGAGGGGGGGSSAFQPVAQHAQHGGAAGPPAGPAFPGKPIRVPSPLLMLAPEQRPPSAPLAQAQAAAALAGRAMMLPPLAPAGPGQARQSAGTPPPTPAFAAVQGRDGGQAAQDWASVLAEAAAIAAEIQKEQEGPAAGAAQQEEGTAAAAAAAEVGGERQPVQPVQPAMPPRLRTSAVLPSRLAGTPPLPGAHPAAAASRASSGALPADLPAAPTLTAAPALPLHPPAALPGPAPHPPLPLQPRPQLAQHAQHGAAAQQRQPAPAPVVAPPPVAGFLEEDPTVISRWLHLAALQLEPLLALAAAPAHGPRLPPLRAPAAGGASTAAAGAAPAHQPAAAAAAAAVVPSPCARFQARVALARRDGTLRALYEAMLCRYQFFRHSPEQLPHKLCDLMLAVLQEAAVPQPQPAPPGPLAMLPPGCAVRAASEPPLPA